MSSVIKWFAGFKSIFTGEDVLKENEEHTNMVIATAMINMFIPLIIIFIISVIDIYGSEDIIMWIIVASILATIIGVPGLVIPSLICFKRKGKGKNLKYILIIALIITLTVVDVLLTYKATLILAIPAIFAARYYSKKFTINVIIVTSIMFAFSTYMGADMGFLDLNYVNVPKDTTITIETTLENSIEDLELSESENAKNVLINSYFPELLIYILFIGFACAQISQSGKKMLERQKELSEEGARIEAELNIANAIQKNILNSIFPAFPEHKEIDIYAEMTPAKEVGGDFYDMFLVDENHLAMAIADVSGKGVPAALIMMIAKTLIQNTTLNGYSVDEVFYRVNNLLCEKNALNHFVTSWFGILDLRTGKLEFVNAGHNPPLIYKKKDNNFEYYKTKPNLILAAMDNTKYQKHELTLEPGDKLFLYTDGVTEATSDKDELYGEQRLKDYLNNHIEQDIENTIKGVKKDIDNFIGTAEQFDDITMLEFLFKEKKGEK